MMFKYLSFLETSTKLCPQQLCSSYRKETASFAVGSEIQLSTSVTSSTQALIIYKIHHLASFCTHNTLGGKKELVQFSS